MDILEQAQFDTTLRRQSPFAQYQIIEVSFNATPTIDTEIVHTLTPPTPDHLAWLVIRQSCPGQIYRNPNSVWDTNYIKLRASVPSMVATILLFVTQDTSLASAATLNYPEGDPWLACGATSLTAGTGFWLAYNNGTPTFRVGDPAGDYIKWDGSTLTVTGTLDVAASGNQLTNSTFRHGLTEGAGDAATWAAYAAGDHSANWTVGTGWSGFTLTNSGTAYLYGAATMNGTDAAYAQGPAIPVKVGDSYEWSAYVITVNSTATAELVFRDASDTALQVSTGTAVTNSQGSGTALSSYSRMYVIATAPATATKVQLRVRWATSGTGINPVIFFTHAMFAQARTGQTDPSPWAPGGITQITGDSLSTDVVIASKLRSSGATALNTGTGIWIDATGTPTFRIGNPSGGYLRWDGSDLKVKGEIEATSGSFTGAITATSGSFAAGDYTINNTGFRYSTTGGMYGGATGVSIFTSSGSLFFSTAGSFAFSGGHITVGSGYVFSGVVGTSGSRFNGNFDTCDANHVLAGDGYTGSVGLLDDDGTTSHTLTFSHGICTGIS